MSARGPCARRPRAWVLNFDAENELASPAGHATPSAAVRARYRELAARVGSLLAPDDVVLDDTTRVTDPARYVGAAWSPTPRALARFAEAGVTVPAAPTLAVLRRVNHRAFAAELGQTLPGAALATTVADVARVVAQEGAGGAGWLLKRPFGFAGRGRRKVHAGPLRDHDRVWVEACFSTPTPTPSDGGALQVEPWVARTLDVGLHGWVSKRGAIELGRLTVQECDAHGAWAATRRAPPDALDRGMRDALNEAVHASAVALRDAGYYGPFGVDAYVWRDPSGALSLNARSEINARYSMGWAVGMRPGEASADAGLARLGRR